MKMKVIELRGGPMPYHPSTSANGIEGSKGHQGLTPSRLGPMFLFFIFMQFSGKFSQNNRLALPPTRLA